MFEVALENHRKFSDHATVWCIPRVTAGLVAVQSRTLKVVTGGGCPAGGRSRNEDGWSPSFDDPQRVSEHEGARDLQERAAGDSIEGLTRYAHARGGLGVKVIFEWAG